MPTYVEFVDDRDHAAALTGDEKFVVTQEGDAVFVDVLDVISFVQDALSEQLTSREFNRAWSETIDFDEGEIFYAANVLTDDVNYTIGVGSLSDLSSSARQRITTDGTHAINFGAGFDFLYGISNGQILEAGTYEVYFFFENGSVSVNFPGTSQQASGLLQLAAPANFVALSNGDDEVDLEWDVVTNASSYRIEYSLTGTGGWSVLSTPSSGTTSEVHSLLTPSTTYYYRIKAVGDSISYSDSPYSTASATTSSAGGDVAAPTFTFAPASGVTNWPVNRSLILTANEPIRNTDGSEITSANVASRITLKETNSGGTNIPFTATIDVSKTIITITPTTIYGDNQLVYAAVNNVEDNSGNEVTVAISSTFTTGEFSYLNGTSNFLNFGDILDSLWTSVDTNFWLEITLNNALLSGYKTLISKYSSSNNQRSFSISHSGQDVNFVWAGLAASPMRVITWAGAIPDSGEHTLVFKYDGSIDTNNGLDRVTLLVDGVVAGSKTMPTVVGVLSDPPNSNAPLCVGAYVNSAGTGTGNYYSEDLKDFIVRSNNGATVQINVPVIRTGVDISGNGRNGTWV